MLNVLDFNLCADCKILRDNTHRYSEDKFRKLRFWTYVFSVVFGNFGLIV